MKQGTKMKTKLLITALTAGIIAACGSDNVNFVVVDTPPPPPVELIDIQAYDGPVMGMPAHYDCGQGPIYVGLTDYDGLVEFPEAYNPESCTVSFGPAQEGIAQIDTDTGKDLSSSVFTAPAGMFSSGAPATASPLTTLLDQILDGAPYEEATATTLLADLGLTDALNETGLTALEFLSNTEAAVDTLVLNGSTEVAQTIATLHAVTDVLVAAPAGATVDQIKTVAVNVTNYYTTAYPNYPENNEGTGDVVINVASELSKPGDGNLTIFDELALDVLTPQEIEQDIQENGPPPTVDQVPVPEPPLECTDPYLEVDGVCVLPGTGSGSGSGTGGSGGGTGG